MIRSITIDGPAASGKSTLGIKLAEHFKFIFFDTGVMYRAVTLAALQRKISAVDENACTELAQRVKIDIAVPSMHDGRLNDVLLDGQDVSWDIRLPDVEAYVSVISAYPGVRQALTEQQRRIGLRGEVVLVGRDTGTVVLPEALVKIYLDASVEERARRRYLEVQARGENTGYQELLDSMQERDRIDSGRDVAPLRPAHDAIIIDSDKKDAEHIFQIVVKLAEEKLQRKDIV
jgi:cytidylate kinase